MFYVENYSVAVKIHTDRYILKELHDTQHGLMNVYVWEYDTHYGTVAFLLHEFARIAKELHRAKGALEHYGTKGY